jgi:hypothetical protein
MTVYEALLLFSKVICYWRYSIFPRVNAAFTFMGYTGKVTYDDVGKEEYEAEL